MNSVDLYFGKIQEILQIVLEKERDKIEQVADLFATSIQKKHTIFAFGCAHGAIPVEELFYRAGGLALINPIFNPCLMLNIKPVNLTSAFEQTSGQSSALLDATGAKSGDCILIHSVSGRNPAIVEMALHAKEKGMNVVGLTNLTYSMASSSRDKSGKLLYQVCDIVIDNHGEFGDAAVEIPGLNGKAGPTSSAIGITIVNSIAVRTSEILSERGVVPPVFLSANRDDSKEHNRKIMNEYRDFILYL